jgi:hypothetical protein
VSFISDRLREFCDRWAAHGSALQTSFSVDYNRFLILSVNEDASAPSGCSIDSSVHALKELEDELDIDFFGRSEIAFFEDGKVVVFPLQELKNLFLAGRLNENTQTLNTLAQTVGDWKNHGKINASESWLKRYIPKSQVS